MKHLALHVCLKGSVSQLLNPISSDFEQSRVVWDYDTNLESREPWLDTGEAVHQTLDNLQNFTNSKLQKQSVSDLFSRGRQLEASGPLVALYPVFSVPLNALMLNWPSCKKVTYLCPVIYN